MKRPSNINGSRDERELKFTARVVSRGTAIGQAVCLYGQKRQFYKIDLPPEKIEAELSRLRFAVDKAAEQLEALTSAPLNDIPEAVADILDVHLLMIRESSLIPECERTLIEDSVNAEWAVKVVSERQLNRLRAVSDEHLREKTVDLQDVTERILNALGGQESHQRLPENSIIFASEIRPSTMLGFLRDKPVALVTEHGGWTSHVFIMARELGIPAVAGVRNALRRTRTGDTVVVDAIDGEVIVRASQDSRDQLLRKLSTIERPFDPSNGTFGLVNTTDGVTVRIAANVDKPEACRRAVEMGANGIGLLRSEYLFDHLNALPNEEVQFAAYNEVAKIVGPLGVRIRTFDINIEQTSSRTDIQEKNPALGLRAIRLSLAQERQFRTQIRSLLRAAHESTVRIVLPLISGVEEIKRALKIIKDEWAKLEKSGVPCGQPELGAMIELPSAVFTINEILRYVDFVCLGTNDLVQYLVGVDRDNEAVAEWYQTLNPAVIRAIRTVLRAADEASIPATVCGEMAGSPFYTPLLIGLGARDLSMNLHSIGQVRQLVSGISHADTLELVRQVEHLETSAEIEEFLIRFYRDRWRSLFSDGILRHNSDKHFENISKN